MTKEELQKCEWAANMYREKVRECEILKMRLEQKERENRLLKERLHYKTASDVQYSKDDDELFRVLNSRKNAEESGYVF
jgi:hypothetical protein